MRDPRPRNDNTERQHRRQHRMGAPEMSVVPHSVGHRHRRRTPAAEIANEPDREFPWQRTAGRALSGPATGTRPLRPRWSRSSGSSARARSCASVSGGTRPSRSSPPDRSRSTSPSASAVFRAAASSRSTARRAAVRPPWPCMRSPTPRSSAASPRSSTPSTPSIPSTPRTWASTPTPCWCPSRTPVSRRWRSWTC